MDCEMNSGFGMPIQAPQWTDYQNCPVCRREFGAPPRSPISLSCGHTLCRHCLKHLHKKQCPFDQTLIQVEPEDLVVNTALLQLAGYAPPAQPYHPPCIQALCERDRRSYDAVVRCMESLAVFLKYCGNVASNSMAGRLSRPMQRKLVTLLQCCVTDEEGRGRCARAARSLGERSVTELILQHQNPQQLSANLWAAVRARGCQFLGPAMQEEVLKLVLLALEDGSALSRKVLVMFVVQRLEPHFPQASKTSIGHVVQLLYRASCFKVSKRESDSSLMQLKEEFRTYESLRREHDAQIVQIATEAGLRIAPDQWSALLYGDTAHKSHMQSIIDKLQTPQSFAQSVQELFIALQRTGDPAQLVVMSMHLDRLAGIDASPDAKSPSWQQLAEVMTSLKEVVSGLIHYYMHDQGNSWDSNHNQKHPPGGAEPSTSQPSPQATATTPTHSKYKVSMCRDAAARSFCPRGNTCTFAHSEEELERYRTYLNSNSSMNGNFPYMSTMPPPSARLVATGGHAVARAAGTPGPAGPAGPAAGPPRPPGLPIPMPLRPVPIRPVMYQRFPMPPPNYNVPPMQSLPPQSMQSDMMQNVNNQENAHTETSQSSNFTPHIPNQPLMQNGLMLPERQYYPRSMLPDEHFREYMPVYQPGYQEPLPMFDNAQFNGIEGLPSEPRPDFRMDPNYALVNRDRHIEQTWTPVNEAFFDGPTNVRQPFQSDAEDRFTSGDRRAVGSDWLATGERTGPTSYSRADDKELEEELEALVRRIDTEFKNAD
ncbi:LOW QUALITY PROTEIN: RING finger and CCCH-type zinc finger domain-containing protein roquin [Choristoneura fumiferana]|uniref:LOW QUALITY PROTEIN: RING finger and CCCH-type zinc finger domain-containing protein roquin n=1 Tax=Choristoneura fumiferana TaxID=7141 RepID=UPI003D15C713